MRYFTSDTHFGHQNIIRYSGRPFADVPEMNAALLDRLNGRVTSADTLWHLGDVAMGRLDESLPNLARVRGGVILVAGNHDRCHPCNGSKSERFIDRYRETCALDDLILTNTRLRLADGTEVNVSHFPYSDESLGGYEDRHGEVIPDQFARWRPVDDGSWLLCGHVHGSWRQRGRMINVGVDAWHGFPVDEERILGLIADGPRDLPPHDWK